MQTYARRTRVRAPIDDVWAFHSRIEGLEALTPDFLGLSVEEVRGPGGDPDPDVLAAGSEVRLSVRPFGVGPRQRWTTRITERVDEGGARWFVDRMENGPFRTWRHAHRFFADGDETVVDDRVEYELPLPPVGDLLGPVAVVGFEPMFRYRHRRTRELLERE